MPWAQLRPGYHFGCLYTTYVRTYPTYTYLKLWTRTGQTLVDCYEPLGHTEMVQFEIGFDGQGCLECQETFFLSSGLFVVECQYLGVYNGSLLADTMVLIR